MSNLDRLWTEQQRSAAAEEGWELGLVVNEGKPVATAYLEIFSCSSRFTSRDQAVRFVISEAHKRSKLHIAALSACSASRIHGAAAAAPKRRKA